LCLITIYKDFISSIPPNGVARINACLTPSTERNFVAASMAVLISLSKPVILAAYSANLFLI
jgi:hypothetical protein